MGSHESMADSSCVALTGLGNGAAYLLYPGRCPGRTCLTPAASGRVVRSYNTLDRAVRGTSAVGLDGQVGFPTSNALARTSKIQNRKSKIATVRPRRPSDAGTAVRAMVVGRRVVGVRRRTDRRRGDGRRLGDHDAGRPADLRRRRGLQGLHDIGADALLLQHDQIVGLQGTGAP